MESFILASRQYIARIGELRDLYEKAKASYGNAVKLRGEIAEQMDNVDYFT